MISNRMLINQRLFEKLARAIEIQIFEGQLKEGDKLPPEHYFSEEYGVSRTVVREAMKSLEQKGLIQTFAGKGTYVTNNVSKRVLQSFDLFLDLNITPENCFEKLLEARDILEPQICSLAAQKASDENLEMIKSLVETMSRNVDDREVFISTDQKFHCVLAESSQNPVLAIMVTSLMGLLKRQLEFLYNMEGSNYRSQENHIKILEAILNHDPLSAEQTMNAHLLQVRQDIEALWAKNPPEPN